MEPQLPTIPRNDATILGLANAGQSTRAIAALTGVHHTTIARQLKHLRPRKSTEIFKSLRADILSEMQRKLLSQCTTPDIKKMNARDRFLAFGILYDKERLERGQSTVNQVSLHADIGLLKGLKPVDNPNIPNPPTDKGNDNNRMDGDGK